MHGATAAHGGLRWRALERREYPENHPKQYLSVWSGIGGWIGLPVTAGLDFNDKFGAIGATAIAKSANLDSIPQGGTLYTFRIDDI